MLVGISSRKREEIVVLHREDITTPSYFNGNYIEKLDTNDFKSKYGRVTVKIYDADLVIYIEGKKCRIFKNRYKEVKSGVLNTEEEVIDAIDAGFNLDEIIAKMPITVDVKNYLKQLAKNRKIPFHKIENLLTESEKNECRGPINSSKFGL